MSMSIQQPDLLVACNLEAEVVAKRKEETSDQLFNQVRKIVELDDGYAYLFPGDDEVLKKLATFIQEERHCCAFLTFELGLEPNHGQITLTMRGPEGAKLFLAGMFGG